jgi:hypothetical protein
MLLNRNAFYLERYHDQSLQVPAFSSFHVQLPSFSGNYRGRKYFKTKRLLLLSFQKLVFVAIGIEIRKYIFNRYFKALLGYSYNETQVVLEKISYRTLIFLIKFQ